MKINVKVKPAAGENKVEKVDETNYKVSVKSPPVGGAANREVVEVLADYFHVPRSKVYISFGYKYKNKVVEINP